MKWLSMVFQLRGFLILLVTMEFLESLEGYGIEVVRFSGDGNQRIVKVEQLEWEDRMHFYTEFKMRIT